MFIEILTSEENKSIRGFIMEVGFSQTMNSLVKRTQAWFTDMADLNILVLINLSETPRGKYVDNYGKEIPPSRLRKGKHMWLGEKWLTKYSGVPQEAILEKELTRRLQSLQAIMPCMGAAESTDGGISTTSENHKILMSIKEDLTEWLLGMDKENILQPSLVDILDGFVYIYARHDIPHSTTNTTPITETGTSSRLALPKVQTHNFIMTKNNLN